MLLVLLVFRWWLRKNELDCPQLDWTHSLNDCKRFISSLVARIVEIIPRHKAIVGLRLQKIENQVPFVIDGGYRDPASERLLMSYPKDTIV
jgi:hypothetical protein